MVLFIRPDGALTQLIHQGARALEVLILSRDREGADGKEAGATHA